MTAVYAALAAAVPLALVCLALLRALASQSRAHARREDLLLNQLLHATGKPWQPAPASEREAEPDPEPDRFTFHPEER